MPKTPLSLTPNLQDYAKCVLYIRHKDFCFNFEKRDKKDYDKTPYVWSTQFTPVKKNTQPLVVMFETFRMSAENIKKKLELNCF